MSLSALTHNFLEYLKFERHASQLTIKNYDHYLKRFLSFAGNTDPKEIDLNLVRAYKLYLARWIDPKTKKGLKKITQNYFMIALRTFLRYLDSINITTLSYEQVELGGWEPKSVQTLDQTSLNQLLEAPDDTQKKGIRDKAILETLFSTGLRVSELTSLNRDDVNLQLSELRTVVRYLNIRQDTFKPLFIRFQGKVDPTDDGETMRLTPRSIERVVEKYVKALGLPVKATPHTFRHNFKICLQKSEN